MVVLGDPGLGRDSLADLDWDQILVLGAALRLATLVMAAAMREPGGSATGVGLWRADQSGSGSEATLCDAAAAGVVERGRRTSPLGRSATTASTW
ncbi:hypothetical protein M1L60_02590 [Actinoplanes sp. TRM 88003]|uniref:Uncharacterized protein n=1 Tax=Paractinoplanes aksuensis TaxID=2939490 RepID=A0ABT1DFA0_9ACTN|nr:hypothetical protein [Actinoplanes aksuensis]MCO8269475.1 hypothetical protein [Actinoplanes aksuensis]